MKIWLDDLRNPKDYNGYEDYKWYKNPIIIKKLIRENKVTHISFDNDLAFFIAQREITGYDVAKVFEEMAFNKTLKVLPVWNIHSANPIGRREIEECMKNMEKFYAR